MRSILPTRVGYILFMLLLSCLGNFLAAQNDSLSVEEEGVEVEEEFMEVKLPFDDPTSILTEDPCTNVHSLSITKVDYDDFARITMDLKGFIPSLYVENILTGKKYFPSQSDRRSVLDLSPGTYEVVGTDNCGKPEVLAEIQTHQYDEDAAVTVDAATYGTIVAWQRDSQGKNFYDYIVESDRLSDQQKLSLFQTAIFKGKAYSSNLDVSKSQFPPNPFIEDEWGGQQKSAVDCQCTLFQLTPERNIYPMDRIRSTGQILANWGSEGDDERTRKNLKIWWAWALEGPSRYQQLWGDTKNCVKAPYAWGWNRGNESAQRDITHDDIEATYQAKIEYNNVCIDGYGYQGDCSCERQIDFEYEYHSVARAQAATERGTFCGSNKYARASVVDFAQVVLAEVNNDNHYEVLASMVNGEKSECSTTYVGPTIDEFLTFAHSVYKMAKGGTVNSSDPSIDGQQQDAWDEDHIEAVIEQIGDLLNEDWMNRTPCGGSVVGTENEIREGNYRYFLRPNTPVRVVLAAGSHLSVGGLRRWNANARLHSSFRLAGVQRGGRNYDYGDHCCFPGTGSYMMSTISGDVPGGPSLSSWQSATRGFLSSYGVSTTISGDKEAGTHVNSPIHGCDNVVVVPRKTDPSNREEVSQFLEDLSLTEIQRLGTTGTNFVSFSVYDAAGRQVISSQHMDRFDLTTLTNKTSNRLVSGMHVVVFHASDGSHQSRKLLVR